VILVYFGPVVSWKSLQYNTTYSTSLIGVNDLICVSVCSAISMDKWKKTWLIYRSISRDRDGLVSIVHNVVKKFKTKLSFHRKQDLPYSRTCRLCCLEHHVSESRDVIEGHGSSSRAMTPNTLQKAHNNGSRQTRDCSGAKSPDPTAVMRRRHPWLENWSRRETALQC